ncbi:hypothetical protein NL676_015730 [Syzygium grande]|nr:hypothetical protein NL676_015730 [Syzygium grande]
MFDKMLESNLYVFSLSLFSLRAFVGHYCFFLPALLLVWPDVGRGDAGIDISAISVKTVEQGGLGIGARAYRRGGLTAVVAAGRARQAPNIT